MKTGYVSGILVANLNVRKNHMSTMTAKDFPILYKKTSTGKIQQWQIWVEDSTIWTEYGQCGGKLQRTSDTIKEGKNIGKKNETSSQEQAHLEALSQWEKKAKKGYVTTTVDASMSVVNTDYITGGVSPMLAHVFSKQGHKIAYPAFAQPKFDGHRCIAVIDNGECTLWTRTQKPITGVPHIVEQLSNLGLPDIILDGELYNHEYKDKFEELTSFIRQETPKEGHEVVQYHVYDVVNDEPFDERFGRLIPYVNAAESVQGVVTYVVDDADKALDLFLEVREQGYEGLMLRNQKSPYVNKRSYDLQKVKEFDDAEFKIVDIIEGRGRLQGKGIFICETENGETFKAKMIGDLENLNAYWERPNDFIGKIVTVQFQGYSKYGIPRFPIAVRFRDDL